MPNLQTSNVLLAPKALDRAPDEEVKRELETLLMRSLAAYILIRKKDPVCDLLEDLLEMELEAGQFLGEALKDPTIQSKLRGSLASILSVIPISTKARITTTSHR